LKKRRLAQLPGCKPDPTNWRWFKKIAAWGRLRVKNVNGKTFGKKVVLFMLELAPSPKKSIGKGFGFPIPSGFASPKKSIGEGIWFYYTLRICIPKKSIGKMERG